MNSKSVLQPVAKILVLDDDEISRRTYKRTIELDLGMEFVEVLVGGPEDVNQLDHMLSGFQPDLVIMAWKNLGIRAIRKVRKYFGTSTTWNNRQVWIISGYPPAKLDIAALQADLIMTKDLCAANVFRALLSEWYGQWYRKATQAAAR